MPEIPDKQDGRSRFERLIAGATEEEQDWAAAVNARIYGARTGDQLSAAQHFILSSQRNSARHALSAPTVGV